MSQSSLCYGLLQSNPANHLGSAAEQMRFSANDTMYLYTSLLGNSTCRNGVLKAFSFCYRPTCRNKSDPEFYIILLRSGEEGYSVVYVHTELEERESCSGNTSVSRCKPVPVNSSVPITVDPSYSVAFVIPEGASGRYLYETESTSPGVILSPAPQVPQVGNDSLELVTENLTQIPNRLFRLVLETVVSSGL